ncbi:hypothetical protein [Microvirga sp. G4-2]|uniref:hypothetical protein n=1 Tax=Microvirga sp. G4-2 TaxID=3434467 RepID=UPI004044A803
MTAQFHFLCETRIAVNAAIQKVHDTYEPVNDELNALLNQASAKLSARSAVPFYVQEIEWRIWEIRRLCIIAAREARRAVGDRSEDYFPIMDHSTVPELAKDYAAGRAAAERDYQRLQEAKKQRNDEHVPVKFRITPCRLRSSGSTTVRRRAWMQGRDTRWHELRRDDEDYRPGRLGEDLP